jgi:hypothetical protein
MKASCLILLMLLTIPAGLSAQDRRDDRDRGESKKPAFDWQAFGDQMKRAVADGDLTDRQAAETDRLMKFYVALDANSNETIEPEEYENSRYRSTIERRLREAGLEPSRPVSLNTFIVKRLESQGIKAAPFTRVLNAYKPRPQEQVGLDLPQAFVPLDADLDNQIGLYEWPKSEIEEFFEFDLNDDGFATPREIQSVEAARAKAAAEME